MRGSREGSSTISDTSKDYASVLDSLLPRTERRTKIVVRFRRLSTLRSSRFLLKLATRRTFSLQSPLFLPLHPLSFTRPLLTATLQPRNVNFSKLVQTVPAVSTSQTLPMITLRNRRVNISIDSRKSPHPNARNLFVPISLRPRLQKRRNVDTTKQQRNLATPCKDSVSPNLTLNQKSLLPPRPTCLVIPE